MVQGSRVLGVEGEPDVAEPSWKEVVAAIERLDGDARSELSLGPPGDVMLVVAGGPDLFHVMLVDPMRDTWQSVHDPTQPSAPHDIVAAGQVSQFRRDTLVDRDAATRAAQAFFEDGDAAGDLSWITD